MMAPHFERARMLAVALQTASMELADPIDRIEVIGARVLVWAGKTCLAMTYYYADIYNPRGEPLLGGGSWVVQPEGPPRVAAGAGLFAALKRWIGG